ncbi:MAG TPA: hypothetical protein VMD28_04665, partial [Acidimicrobiales bacterium]|nr:hypothetical protein [Acidimicrobiales bacterium]
ILWTARRWELFRLSVDSVPIGHQPGEAAVPAHLVRREVMGLYTSRGRSPGGASPLKLAASNRGDEPCGERGGDPVPDAVIRHLPVRPRSTGATGAD